MNSLKNTLAKLINAMLVIAFVSCSIVNATEVDATDINATETSTVEADQVLELAEKAGQWIASTAIKQTQGIVWPDNALEPDKISDNLASGVAGKVVYFTALYRATGKPQYLNYASQGGDYLIALLETLESFQTNQRKASLYAGISGIGVALMHLDQVKPSEHYTKALNKIVSLLDRWSVEKDNLRYWSERFNDLLYGDTGTVLFLSYFAEQYHHALAAKMAKQGGHFLLSQAKSAKVGCYWLFRRDKAFNLPNFSHGTAGVIYTLARVGKQMNDAELIAGAKAGFEYLNAIAKIEHGKIAMPYGWGSDNWKDLYEFGWAHGLTGVALSFTQLQHYGVELKKTQRLLLLIQQTLTDVNLQGKPGAPFAEPSTPLDYRFGRAGVLSLFSHWSRGQAKGTNIIKLRNALWQQIADSAQQTDSLAYWPVDAPEFMGGGRAHYTGLFHGAAGIGMALLNMHAAMTGKQPYSQLPDDPFS